MNKTIAHAFIRTVYSEALTPPYHAVVLGIRGGRPNAQLHPRRCNSVDEVVVAVEYLAGEQYNTYYPMALIGSDAVLPSGARGSESDVKAFFGLHVDIDLKGPAHPDANVPDVSTAMKILDSFEVPASIVVFTGHGIQAIWLFKEPWAIGSEEERRRAKRLVRRHVGTLAAIGRQLGGYAVDSTGDLARVLRMPGTINRAARGGVELLPVETHILRPEGGLDGGVLRYNPEDIEEYLIDLDDEVGVDFSLVGPFTMHPEAATPAVVIQACERSEALAALWRNEAPPYLRDKSTSSYRFHIIGHLVDAGADDQAIADAVCAWYRDHHPDYDKHLRRPWLIAGEIAKHRTRRANKHAQPSGSPPVVPVIDGPCGISLRAVEASSTTKRRRARFEVHLNGADTGAELSVTDTPAGLRTANEDLSAILRDAGRTIEPEATTQVQSWLRKTATAKGLGGVIAGLHLYNAYLRSVATAPAAPTMREIAQAHMLKSLDLAFTDEDGSIWSEHLGRSMARCDFMNHLDEGLVKAIASASNFPTPTQADPTKPQRHLQQEFKVVWTTLSGSLPREVDCDRLSSGSKAALRLREQIARLWLSPETWMRIQGRGAEQERVERMSLASRVRELVHEARGRPPAWTRVLAGVNAFYRVEPNPRGQRVVWLGMRSDLCQGAIKGVKIPNIKSQQDLTRLMTRYGLLDLGSVTDRLREGKDQQRVCVLSRELTDYLIDCVDPEADPDAVTRPAPASVTAVSDEERIDRVTGEVVDAR